VRLLSFTVIAKVEGHVFEAPVNNQGSTARGGQRGGAARTIPITQQGMGGKAPDAATKVFLFR